MCRNIEILKHSYNGNFGSRLSGKRHMVAYGTGKGLAASVISTLPSKNILERELLEANWKQNCS